MYSGPTKRSNDMYAGISKECEELNRQHCDAIINQQKRLPPDERVSPFGKSGLAKIIDFPMGVEVVPKGALDHYITTMEKEVSIPTTWDKIYFWLHTKFPWVFRYKTK